ncbi:MAG: carbohydrate ABC transporter permease [Verrucomicrobia bacterium]|nr:carbohydrate ABC transporter permease [Verrucomicrobiota bacterium]
MRRALWLAASWRIRATTYIILIVASIWVLTPFVWAIQNSIKGLTDTFNPAAIIPFVNYRPTLSSWIKVLSDNQAIPALLSSLIVSSGTTLLVILLGTPAAYSLAQFDFPVRGKDLNLWFYSQRIMPPVVVLAPFFILLVEWKLVDTWLGLMLIYTTFNLTFGIVIMRDVFGEISRDINDAAKVDGANAWQIFWLIAIPLSADGLIVTAIIVFSFCWNEALFASALAPQHAATLATFVLASRNTQGVNFNIAAVNTLIAIMPPVLMSLFVHRYLARGLTFGVVKG